jgi:hypothetical protein
VDYRFKSDEWERLTPAERIYRCRVMAEEARQLSNNASPDFKQVYLDLADQWSKLASKMENTLPK